MCKTKTYIDTCVLIAAAVGNDECHARAMSIIGDPNREFVASHYLELEVLPNPIYFNRQSQVRFYKTFFGAVKEWISPSIDVLNLAILECQNHNVGPMDALHLASAALLEVDEFITAESPTKPMLNTTIVNAKTIR